MRAETKEYIDSMKKISKGTLKEITPPPVWFTGREKETEAVIECLYKKRMQNCLLVGKAGSGKTTIIQKVAQQAIDGFMFLQFDITSAIAGTIYVGMFEERVKKIFDHISRWNSAGYKDGKFVLFVDEAHTLWTAEKNQYAGTIGMANILKPYLSDGNLIIIGATTDFEYEECIKADRALLRRVSPVFLDPLPKEDVIEALRGFSEGSVDDGVLEAVFEESTKIENFSNPDSSMELLDRCMARRKRSGLVIDGEMVKSIAKDMNVAQARAKGGI